MDIIKNINKIDLLKIIIDNTPIAYCILDDEYRVHFVNNSFLNLFELDKGKVIGEKCYTLSNSGSPCANCALSTAISTNERALISRKDILPNGEVRFLDDYVIPLEADENEKNFFLEILVDRTEEMIIREKKYSCFQEIIDILSTLLNTKDAYTAYHSQNVKELSYKIAKELGLPPNEISDITLAASLHDIGKIYIPNNILNKPGSLDENEWQYIKQHPIYSYNILEGLFSFKNIRNIVKYHHEKLDGSGYPENLKDKNIPLGSKIIAVADSYDAMTSKRVYKNAYTHKYAMKELKDKVDIHYSKDVYEAFLKIDFVNNINDIAEESSALLERNVIKTTVDKKTQDHLVQIESFNEDNVINEIFENTPCGYVIINRHNIVEYVNEYFLNYTTLEKEKFINKKYYRVRQTFVPAKQSIVDAFKTNEKKFKRILTKLDDKKKVTDLHIIPIGKKKANYVIVIIIDRTSEITSIHRLHNDFRKLIDILTNLLGDVDISANKEFTDQIYKLKKRLNVLLSDI